MGKVTSLQGKATGKVGSMVYSIAGGQMIAREYQPHVANPNTVAQTDQRAKFKLMSQLAAALAPVIVIPKEGLKSSRNLFIKRNNDSVSATDGIAQITYENVQLTNGNAGLPAIEATRDVATGISINLAERCDAAVSRVVYIVYKKTSEQTLQYMESIIVSAPGSEGKFPGTLLYIEGDICLFAYGMKDLNAKASAKYNNYSVSNGEDIARLVMKRNLSLSDYQFTQTRGTTMFAGENTTTSVPEGSARVFVTPEGPGSVSGAGVFEIGTQVTVRATPNEGARFRGWRRNGDDQIISTEANYTFELTAQADLVATFYVPGQNPTYSIGVTGKFASEMGGSYNQNLPTGITFNAPTSVEAGLSVSLTTAKTAGNYAFAGWYDVTNSRTLSNNETYSFTPSGNMVIECRWYGLGDE